MSVQITWTVWPTNRLTADDLEAIEDALKTAIGPVEYEERLVKSETAPIHVVVTWLLQNLPGAVLGATVAKLADGLSTSARVLNARQHLRDATVGSVADYGTYRIEFYTPVTHLVPLQPLLDAERLGRRAAETRTNVFGLDLGNFMDTTEVVSPGGRLSAPVHRILFTWNDPAHQFELIQVELAGRGRIYMPRPRRE